MKGTTFHLTLIFLTAILVGVFLLGALTRRGIRISDPTKNPEISWRYAVIIDAGSSGSRLHVFRYHAKRAEAYCFVDLPERQLRVAPGLSAYAPDGKGAGQSLIPLIKFAHAQVPQHNWSDTPIHLMATAGLRMLPPAQATAILDSARQQLAASGFMFNPAWAKVLPGELEGLYAWAAVNYAAGNLQDMAAGHSLRQGWALPSAAHTTWGVFELGGASMQLTFLPQGSQDVALPAETSHHIPLPGVEGLPLYTHSFLGYGMDVAYFRTAMLIQQRPDKRDPCLPLGFETEAGIIGRGDFNECRSITAQLLPEVPCKFKQCSVDGAYLPPLTGLHLGMENFYYTAFRLGLPPSATLAQLEHAARGFCNRTWTQLQMEFQEAKDIPQEYLLKTCFGAAYIWTLLHDGFEVQPHEQRIVFTNVVEAPDGRPLQVNWSLGALLVEVVGPTGPPGTPSTSNGLQPWSQRGSSDSSSFSNSSWAWVALFLSSSVLALLLLCLYKGSAFVRRQSDHGGSATSNGGSSASASTASSIGAMQPSHVTIWVHSKPSILMSAGSAAVASSDKV